MLEVSRQQKSERKKAIACIFDNLNMKLLGFCFGKDLSRYLTVYFSSTLNLSKSSLTMKECGNISLIQAQAVITISVTYL